MLKGKILIENKGRVPYVSVTSTFWLVGNKNMTSNDVLIFTARKRSLGQGNIFTPVCHSVHRGGLPKCMMGYHPPDQASPRPGAPRTRHPPQTRHPQTRHPLYQPPRHRACWEIRSTRGWYASYWNAILFVTFSYPKVKSDLSSEQDKQYLMYIYTIPPGI